MIKVQRKKAAKIAKFRVNRKYTSDVTKEAAPGKKLHYLRSLNDFLRWIFGSQLSGIDSSAPLIAL
jgi:hypothetical protein